jgi:hypothetical protein
LGDSGLDDSRPVPQNILGVTDAVPAMLDVFQSTGFTPLGRQPGLLFDRTREDLLLSPAVWPAYRNRRLCAYEELGGLGASALKRLLRFADSYMRVNGDNSYRPEWRKLPVNVPANRFLRPYSRRLAALDGLRLRHVAHSASIHGMESLTMAGRAARIAPPEEVEDGTVFVLSIHA